MKTMKTMTTMTKNTRLFPTLMLAGFASMGTSVAALVATDLNDGGTDTGFSVSSNWIGSNNVFIIASSDLTYANYGITQTGTIQRVYTSNAGPDRQKIRDLATPMSGEIWFSVLVNVPTGSNYAGLTFNNTGNTFDPITTAARILMGPTQLQVGFNGGAATTGTGTFTAGATHLLLGQMNIGLGNDTLNVWVDPDVNAAGGPSGLPAANFSSTTVDFTDSITILGVAGSKGTDPTASDVFIDAIRLSDTTTAFADVTGVPEPSAALLGGLGLLALLRRRR